MITDIKCMFFLKEKNVLPKTKILVMYIDPDILDLLRVSAL